MNIELTEPEVRVLGCLIEKEITTPEYYPLSLNSLINACNQKTNRDPVVSYNECVVTAALDALRNKELVIVCNGRDSRVPKYDNYFAEAFSLSKAEVAAMCVLMLRGAQTIGEIRGRTERMHEFAELTDVEETLDKLASREDGPLITRLSRQPGHKESRYMHLLAGEVDVSSSAAETLSYNSELESKCAEIDRIERLEAEVAELRRELADFRKQFD